VSTGIGEITIEEGKYVAYTRELEIDRGRLVFSGGPISDPGIDIRAIKKLPDNVIAGVNVRGTLHSPRITFFSDPPLTQNQIASLLITGRTLDSLQDETTTQSTGQGRDALLAQGGAMLAGRLGEQVGLQDVTVESNKANEQSLVLGTYLSPRLYVSYGISLAEAINTFKLRYTLGDRWTIKTEAGEVQSADLVFTIDK
jgi:translocation and assembly module TamB